MVVSDSVTISADADTINIVSEGDQSNVDFQISGDSDGVIDLDGGEAKSMFSLDYLSKMIGAKSLSDTVNLKLGEDFPMRLAFLVPAKADLRFALAPLIAED